MQGTGYTGHMQQHLSKRESDFGTLATSQCVVVLPRRIIWSTLIRQASDEMQVWQSQTSEELAWWLELPFLRKLQMFVGGDDILCR